MSVEKRDKPNVLFIIADDMTSTMMGCAGSSFYETPNLDRMAQRGSLFTQAYGTGPVCSPSRASLMTGRHPARLHLTNYTPGSVPDNPPLLTPEWKPYLPEEEDTLGNIFQTAGYATGHFGKWHLNRDYNHYPNRPMDPERQGFQEVYTTVKPKPDADPEADAHSAMAITDKAVDFIGRHQEDPFLCVIEHNLIHRPEIESAALIDKYRRKPDADDDTRRPELGAMVERLDRSIGILLEKLDSLNLTEKTWVVFTADHGTPGRQEIKRPLRGAKASLYEGGIRVPLLFQYPREVPEGNRIDTPVTGADVAVTLALIANPRPARAEYDGIDLRPLLSGDNSNFKSRPLFWHFPHYHHQGIKPCGAIRKGDFKLIEWFEESIGGSPPELACELYHLLDDPLESENLSSTKPEIRDELLMALQSWRTGIKAQEMRVNPDYRPELETVMPSPGH